MQMRSTHLAAVTSAVLLTACVTLASPGCGPTPGPIEVTAVDSSSEQRLTVGQELRVVLDANPTTGYQWAIDGELPTVLERVGEPDYEATSDALGAGGTETWTLRAVGPGAGLLRLKYWRSFEPTATPADDFEVKVIVE